MSEAFNLIREGAVSLEIAPPGSRFAALAADRLQASRLQLLDVDGARNA